VNLHEIAQRLGMECLTPECPGDPGREVAGGFASDLLSDVLAHAPQGGVLVTVQVHLNVIAVSVHAELAGVIFAGGRRPDSTVTARAVQEGIALYASAEPAFDVVGQLYALGLRGRIDNTGAGGGDA
jgi:hypothetical protein